MGEYGDCAGILQKLDIPCYLKYKKTLKDTRTPTPPHTNAHTSARAHKKTNKMRFYKVS